MITMALNHIGCVQEELKQYDMAEQALEQSLAIGPTLATEAAEQSVSINRLVSDKLAV